MTVSTKEALDAIKRFASIAKDAQMIANQRGGDYAALTFDEMCEFMTQYDDALTKLEDGFLGPPMNKPRLSLVSD